MIQRLNELPWRPTQPPRVDVGPAESGITLVDMFLRVAGIIHIVALCLEPLYDGRLPLISPRRRYVNIHIHIPYRPINPPTSTVVSSFMSAAH